MAVPAHFTSTTTRRNLKHYGVRRVIESALDRPEEVDVPGRVDPATLYYAFAMGFYVPEVRKASVWPAVATNSQTDTVALTMP